MKSKYEVDDCIYTTWVIKDDSNILNGIEGTFNSECNELLIDRNRSSNFDGIDTLTKNIEKAQLTYVELLFVKHTKDYKTIIETKFMRGYFNGIHYDCAMDTTKISLCHIFIHYGNTFTSGISNIIYNNALELLQSEILE